MNDIRSISPYVLREGEELHIVRNSFKKIKTSYVEELIIKTLLKYAVLNSFFLSFEVNHQIKKEKEVSIKKSLKKLFDNGYVIKYTYSISENVEGADNPVFYALSYHGYMHGIEKQYPCTYEEPDEKEVFITSYVLKRAELNQWFLSLENELSRRIDIESIYQKYVYTTIGTVFVPACIKTSMFQLFVFNYDRQNLGFLYNTLLSVNYYVKENRELFKNPLFLIVVPNEEQMQEAFRNVYTYKLLSTMPTYYAFDLPMPVCIEHPSEWLFHMSYEEDKEGNGYISARKVSVLPKEN